MYCTFVSRVIDTNKLLGSLRVHFMINLDYGPD